MSGPVEVKVTASSIAAALTGAGLWALQSYVFHGDVPLPVLAAVQTLVPAVVTFAAGYLAPHTPRPDLLEDEPAPPVVGRPREHRLDGTPGERPARGYMTADEHGEVVRRYDDRGEV